MNDFKVNVFYNKDLPSINIVILKVFRDYLKEYLESLDKNNNLVYIKSDKELSSVKVKEDRCLEL